MLERIHEEEDEGDVHPDDATAEQIERSWREPGFTDEEKRDLVPGPLLAECEVREDEGELWHLREHSRTLGREVQLGTARSTQGLHTNSG